MTIERSKAATRICSLALVFLILTPLSALGTRLGLWPYTIGLLLLSFAMLGSLLIQIINAIWLRRKPSAGTASTLRWASLLALPPLVVMATMMSGEDAARASIHDISTDLEAPPTFVAAIIERGEDSNSLEYSAEIAAIQRSAFPDIISIKSDKSPQHAFAAAIKTIKILDWNIYAQDQPQGRIEAVDTTFWFGFKDDIVIRIRASTTGSIIDLRSVSRVGRGDLGANANRIRLFREQFNKH